jgi:hypothetical protein
MFELFLVSYRKIISISGNFLCDPSDFLRGCHLVIFEKDNSKCVQVLTYIIRNWSSNKLTEPISKYLPISKLQNNEK